MGTVSDTGGDGPVTDGCRASCRKTPKTGRPRPHSRASDVPRTLDHQPGGPGGQFPPRDRTTVGQQHFAVEAGRTPGPQTDCNSASSRSTSRPATRGEQQVDVGSRAHVFLARPVSARRASRTRGPARRAHRLPASAPRPRGHHAAGADTSTAARPADRRGSRRRRTPHGRRSAACAGRERPSRRCPRRPPAAGGRPPAEGRAAAIPRPRRGLPGQRRAQPPFPVLAAARSSRAGRVQLGRRIKRHRGAPGWRPRGRASPLALSPAARRRSPEPGATRALARQAARSPSHSASMAPMRR